MYVGSPNMAFEFHPSLLKRLTEYVFTSHILVLFSIQLMQIHELFHAKFSWIPVQSFVWQRVERSTQPTGIFLDSFSLQTVDTEHVTFGIMHRTLC